MEKVNDEQSILIFENSSPFQVAWREIQPAAAQTRTFFAVARATGIVPVGCGEHDVAAGPQGGSTVDFDATPWPGVGAVQAALACALAPITAADTYLRDDRLPVGRVEVLARGCASLAAGRVAGKSAACTPVKISRPRDGSK